MFVDELFEVTGLPLVRVAARRGYSEAALRDAIVGAIAKGKEERNAVDSRPGEASTGAAAPSCPRCGSAMKLRTAKKGKHRGDRFWGCESFPKCTGKLPAGE